MSKNNKPIPSHAYAFSASVIPLMLAAVNHLTDGNPQLTKGEVALFIGLITLGFYDLEKEHRLSKAFSPLTKGFSSLWQAATAPAEREVEEKNTPAPRL